MADKKIFDLVAATGEEATDVVLSDVLPEVVKEFGTFIVSEGVAELVGQLVGAVFPRLNSIRLSYKQNRLERNMKIMLQRLVESGQSLEERIVALETAHEGPKLIQQTSELLLDGIVDEIQEEKVKYNVNGFLNLLRTDKLDLDMSLMFFKTLYELNDYDIRVLGTYDTRYKISGVEDKTYPEEHDYTQRRLVREKLARLGLIRSKNDEKSAKNLDLIIDYLKQVEKDSKAPKPKGVRLPKFKSLQRTDSYTITTLGRTFLQLISENCDLSNVRVTESDDDNEDVSQYI